MSDKLESPKLALLMGPPGVGKTEMIVRTAPHRPVHVIDVDRKIRASARLAPFLRQDVTITEIRETFTEGMLRQRVRQLASKEATVLQPKGWEAIAEAIYDLEKSEHAKRAGTWALDSITLAGEHLKAFIAHIAKRNKFFWDQWSAYLTGWRDTMSVIRDMCHEHGKDFMATVHERFREVPGDRTTGVQLIREASPTGETTLTRDYKGTMDIDIWASVDGQFGEQVGAFFDEVYALRVEANPGGTPKWICRVHPDGRRKLRTTFNVAQSEFAPDFRLIWKEAK